MVKIGEICEIVKLKIRRQRTDVRRQMIIEFGLYPFS